MQGWPCLSNIYLVLKNVGLDNGLESQLFQHLQTLQKKKEKEAEDTPQQQLPTPTTPMT